MLLKAEKMKPGITVNIADYAEAADRGMVDKDGLTDYGRAALAYRNKELAKA